MFMLLAMGLQLSLVVRKPDFCICENKDADQLRGNREADQRLCFRYTDSTIPLNHLLWLYSPVCVGPGRNPEERVSHNEAQLTYMRLGGMYCWCLFVRSNEGKTFNVL